MSILDIQRRLRRLGQIRMGTKGPKGNPVKLDTWRITSQDEQIIHEIAKAYGGAVTKWDQGWECVTTTDTIPVEVAPQDIEQNQHYELWAKSGRVRRCNGETCMSSNGDDTIKEVDCLCDPEDRDCSPHTSVSFVLYEIPGLGVFTLSTTGYHAAAEMKAMVPMLQGSGRRVVLRMDRREVRRPGQPVHRFTTPVIDAPVSLSELRGEVALNVPVGLPSPAIPVPSADEVRGILADREIVDAVVVGDDTVSDPISKVESSNTPPGVANEQDASEVGEGPSDHGTAAYLRQKMAEAEQRVIAADGDLRELLDEEPWHKPMVPMEADLRRLFRMMEGHWSGDALHAALKKRGAAHVGDLKRAELMEFCRAAWTAANKQLEEEKE